MARTKAVPRSLAAAADNTKKRKYKSRNGVQALRQIRRLQRSIEPLSSKTGIETFVRAMPEMRDYQLQSTVVDALREASEAYLTDLFRRSMITCVNRGSKTLTVGDMRSTLAVLKGVGPN